MLMKPRDFARKLAAGDGFAHGVTKGQRLWEGLEVHAAVSVLFLYTER